MTINSIQNYINNNKKMKTYDEFSVFIPLIIINNEIHLLFEKRALSLNSQPGEICFPGGKKEDGETPSYSSVRETMEELNIKQDKIEILNNLGYFFTPFNYKINVFLGYLKNVEIDKIEFNKWEVDSIFTVPLKHFVNQSPEEYKLNLTMNIPKDFPFEKIIDGKNYSFKQGIYNVNFYEYKDNVIWGITANILKIFLNNIKGSSIF
ncbi:MAG: CoA pyrophosphatase [Bacillota bacterium]|nr:CoA pyrophosphatase [Bacillota bacterium]